MPPLHSTVEIPVSLRSLLTGFWIAAVALGGAFLGVRLAQKDAAPAPFVADRPTPPFLASEGSSLPRVQVVGDDLVPVSTTDLLGPGRTVVLFLDPERDPCRFAARQWQNRLERGDLGDLKVLGICPASREDVQRFRSHLALDFPIYADPTGTHLHDYGVDSFPWEVVVDPQGTILTFTGDLTRIATID